MDKPAHPPAAAATIKESAADRPAKKRKLSYRDQRELDNLPGLLEQLESRQQELEETVSRPDFYQGDHAQTESVLTELARVQAELESTFERWAELEGDDDLH